MAASNLTIRVATAAVALPLLVALLFAGPAWGWLLFLLLATVLGALELFSMTHPGDRVAAVVGALTSCAVMASLFLRAREPRLFVCTILLVPFVGIALTLARLGEMRTAALRLLAAGFGPIYLGVGFGAVASLRVEGEPDGAAFVLLSLGLAWLSDTGGYFAGRAFGKRKLYQAVSPKKTVAGAVGGVLTAIGGTLIIRWLVLRSLPWLDAVLLAALGSMMGQLGDLGESVLKRSVGVKDSGAAIPGHGGMLDRVDAALITAPVVLGYVLIFR